MEFRLNDIKCLLIPYGYIELDNNNKKNREGKSHALDERASFLNN